VRRLLVESTVRLSPGCQILVQADAVIIDTRETELRVQTPKAPELARLLSQLFRPNVPRHVISENQLEDCLVEPVLQALSEDDLLLDEGRANDASEPEEALDALLAEARFHARSIFAQPFWSELLSGTLSTAQVLGWGVEFYHFVDAANDYMSLGVAHARGHRSQRGMLARHLIEEMDHGQIFLNGLARSGVDPGSVQEAPPLPHTAALVNLLAEMAIEGEVTYAASFAVMQPGLATASREAVDAFYKELSELYPFAEPMLEAFRRHAVIDVDLHHEETVFARICRDDSGLSRAERIRARWAMRALAESFVLFFEGIRDGYPKAGSFAPRRALSVSGL